MQRQKANGCLSNAGFRVALTMINEQLPAFHSTAIPWYTAAKAYSSAHRRLDAGMH
jgi:hypothetical protein